MKRMPWFSVFLPILLVGQLAAQTGYNGLAIDGNLVFPQFAVGGGWSTDFFLQNPGNQTDASGALYFFDENGSPLTLQYNGASVSRISVNVPMGSIQKIPVTVTPSVLKVGWAIFVTNPGTPNPLPEVFGSLVFTFTSGSTVSSQIGVLGSRYSIGGFKRISIPIQVVDAMNTGVAVVNAGSSSLNVTYELKDAIGNIISRDTTISGISSLAPGAHISKYVDQIFAGVSLSNFLGSLDLITDGEGLVPLGLILNGNIISTIPTINVSVVPKTMTVVDSGFSFSPATITIRAGDTVKFSLLSMHNVIEVSKATWDANGNTSNGGFTLPFGGGSLTFARPGIHYFVCGPHSDKGMKGTIVVN
jgi:plastocyanin